MGRAAGWGRPGQPALQQSSGGANTSRWKKWESNDLGLHGGPSCFRPSSGARPWARVGGGRWEQTERSEIHPTKHPERQLVELGSRVYLRVGLGDTVGALALASQRERRVPGQPYPQVTATETAGRIIGSAGGRASPRTLTRCLGKLRPSSSGPTLALPRARPFRYRGQTFAVLQGSSKPPTRLKQRRANPSRSFKESLFYHSFSGYVQQDGRPDPRALLDPYNMT